MVRYTRTYVERFGNGVTTETFIKDGPRRIVYLAVKKNGKKLFKKTIIKRSAKFICEIARLRDTIAKEAQK